MFTTETVDNVLIAIPPRELTASSSENAKASLLGLIDAANKEIVVDLSELVFIDSSGLGTLIAAKKTANEHGGDVRLCGLSPQVWTIFELTRLDKVFKIFSNRDEAVESFL
ncbi:MAG: STAS domain-containing protein [Thermoanaerobaculales bacterium]|nr:STAS domain-containing protein [Thermoanaerobaculales bacterium]